MSERFFRVLLVSSDWLLGLSAGFERVCYAVSTVLLNCSSESELLMLIKAAYTEAALLFGRTPKTNPMELTTTKFPQTFRLRNSFEILSSAKLEPKAAHKAKKCKNRTEKNKNSKMTPF